MKFDYAASTALVTGASRGIGAEIARELAARGIARLVLTARTMSDLEALAKELWEKHETAIEVIAADLAQPDAPETLHKEIAARGLSIDLLVNNAGFGSRGFFDELDQDTERQMIAVNVTALVALTGLYLPEMVKRGRGGILNVGSTAAFQPVPYTSTYAATKAFVQSFSEALWAENKEHDNDVRITCLCPGPTDTNFGGARQENIPRSSPDDVAKAGLDALDRNAPFVVVGAANYLGSLTPRFFPRSVVARVAATLLRPKERPADDSQPARRPPIGAAAAIGLTAGIVAGVGLAAIGILRSKQGRQ